MTCLRTLISVVFAVLSPLEGLFDNCAQTRQRTNFIGAKNEFQKAVDKERICSFLSKKQCEFVFNAPSASHTGGVWERQIKNVRNILNGILLLEDWMPLTENRILRDNAHRKLSPTYS